MLRLACRCLEQRSRIVPFTSLLHANFGTDSNDRIISIDRSGLLSPVSQDHAGDASKGPETELVRHIKSLIRVSRASPPTSNTTPPGRPAAPSALHPNNWVTEFVGDVANQQMGPALGYTAVSRRAHHPGRVHVRGAHQPHSWVLHAEGRFWGGGRLRHLPRDLPDVWRGADPLFMTAAVPLRVYRAHVQPSEFHLHRRTLSVPWLSFGSKLATCVLCIRQRGT